MPFAEDIGRYIAEMCDGCKDAKAKKLRHAQRRMKDIPIFSVELSPLHAGAFFGEISIDEFIRREAVRGELAPLLRKMYTSKMSRFKADF